MFGFYLERLYLEDDFIKKSSNLKAIQKMTSLKREVKIGYEKNRSTKNS